MVRRLIMEKGKIVGMYSSGMMQREIGQTLGVSQQAIHQFMKKHKIKARKSAGRPKKEVIENE